MKNLLAKSVRTTANSNAPHAVQAHVRPNGVLIAKTNDRSASQHPGIYIFKIPVRVNVPLFPTPTHYWYEVGMLKIPADTYVWSDIYQEYGSTG